MRIEFTRTLAADSPRHLLLPFRGAVAPQPPHKPTADATAFDLEPGEYQSLPGENGARYWLFRLDPEWDFAATLTATRKLIYDHREKFARKIDLFWSAADDNTTLEALVNGLVLGTYSPKRWSSEPNDKEPWELRVSCPPVCEPAVRRGFAVADTQMRVMDLVNAPSNYKTATQLGAWAEASAQAFGYTARVLTKSAIEELGLHALLAVNRGSEEPPTFTILEYRGPGSPEQPTVLAGKGVTFDTGGLSIKPSANLHLMKSDMGGAAAVFGTLEVAARLRLPVHLVGLVPATDNAVDARSIKPGDVIRSYSGKTIEVIDTDAEGRLILADALAYATKHYEPARLIDLATLTGSSVRTLGYAAGALFTNDEALARQLYAAGQQCGEKVWRLPLWDDYASDLHSDVADLANYSGKPVAGAINAGKFLEAFTNEHPHWAHLDIAGVALKQDKFAKGRAATAFGVRLLLTFLTEEAAAAEG
jgi:leucyl aminopeptidase